MLRGCVDSVYVCEVSVLGEGREGEGRRRRGRKGRRRRGRWKGGG